MKTESGKVVTGRNPVLCAEAQSIAGMEIQVDPGMGYCETCGEWCDGLAWGICEWCQDYYHVMDQ